MFGRYEGLMKELAAKMKDSKGYPVKASFSLGVGGPQCQSAQQSQAASSESSGPTSLGGALGGALGGMFGKKKQAEPAPSTTPPPAVIAGLTPLMTVSTELVSINRAVTAPQTFEIPADYKKTAD
jgi:hypothetical protein